MTDTPKPDELKVLNETVKKLESLTEEERERVLVYINDRFKFRHRPVGEVGTSQPMAKPSLRST
jgi:hypothetical protein